MFVPINCFDTITENKLLDEKVIVFLSKKVGMLNNTKLFVLLKAHEYTYF